MWTGRQTLASIEGAIAKLHGEEGQLDGALRSAVGDAERLRKERSEALRELARIKLDEMAAGRLVGNLDAGERRAVRDPGRLPPAHRSGHGAARGAAEGGRRRARRSATRQPRPWRRRSTRSTRLRAQAEASVQATPGVAGGQGRVRDAADAVAAEAEKKAAASEAELGAKKKPYDEDPLFAYLWRRRFGTSEYQCRQLSPACSTGRSRISSALRDARPNYAALIEIPLRLREHATAKRAGGGRAAGRAVGDRAPRHARGRRRGQGEGAGRGAPQAGRRSTIPSRRSAALLRKVDAAREALVAGDTNPAYNEALVTHRRGRQQRRLGDPLRARRAARRPSADEAIVAPARDDRCQASPRPRARSPACAARRSTSRRRRRRSSRCATASAAPATIIPRPPSRTTAPSRDALKSVLEGVVRSGVLWDLLRQGYGSAAHTRPPGFRLAGFSLSLSPSRRLDQRLLGWRVAEPIEPRRLVAWCRMS